MDKNNKKMMIIRFLATLVLFVSVFVISWWLIIFLSILFAVFFKKPYEIIIAGFFMDALYSAPILFSQNLNIFYTILFFIIFASSFYIKEKMLLDPFSDSVF